MRQTGVVEKIEASVVNGKSCATVTLRTRNGATASTGIQPASVIKPFLLREGQKVSFDVISGRVCNIEQVSNAAATKNNRNEKASTTDNTVRNQVLGVLGIVGFFAVVAFSINNNETKTKSSENKVPPSNARVGVDQAVYVSDSAIKWRCSDVFSTARTNELFKVINAAVNAYNSNGRYNAVPRPDKKQCYVVSTALMDYVDFHRSQSDFDCTTSSLCRPEMFLSYTVMEYKNGFFGVQIGRLFASGRDQVINYCIKGRVMTETRCLVR